MNTIQRIAKNTGVLFAARIASSVLFFFYWMYTARYLGPSNFGILVFALAFTGIFGVITDFGLYRLIVREVARDKSLASKYLANISGMKIILAPLTFGLIALTINLLDYPDQTVKIVYLLALSVIFDSFTQMFYSIFQAYESMEYYALGQILNGALMLFGVIFAIHYGFGVTGFAVFFFLVRIVVLVYSFVILKIKFSTLSLAWFPRKIEVDWSFWKPTIKEALPFGLAIVFTTIFYWVDSVMLSLMKGATVVGWYNAAYKMVLAILFFLGAFNAAVFPVMSKFYVTSQDSLRLTYEKSFKYLTIVGVSISVGTALLAPRFISLIFGAEYNNSIIALQILAWSLAFIFMVTPFSRLFQASNKQIISAKIAGICVVFNVVLNLILIPKYSLIGASIATVLTEFLSLVLAFIWSLKIGYAIANKEVVSIMTRVLISSALMGIFIMHFRSLALWALVPSAALLYFVILYIIGGIKKEDVNLVRRIVGKI